MASPRYAPVRAARVAYALALVAAAASSVQAQALGTFRWQLQPFCNVVVVAVTQEGASYRLDGYDDMCGAVQRAPLVGLATPNADGTIGLGLNIVTAQGSGVHVGARISLPTASGTWVDSAENTGAFALGANTGGSPRTLPASGPGVPPAIQLLADGGVRAVGALGVGAVPAVGAGERLMWFPGKGAFRAGGVEGTQWDDANLGVHSVAAGFNTTASGIYSMALGRQTTASGVSSTALGAFSTASGSYSTAVGYNTAASAIASTALGLNTIASGPYSTAMGGNTSASGPYGTAVGYATLASGDVSTAFGDSTRARGYGTTVMGALAEATTAAPGSFVYGDRSTIGVTNNVVTSVSPNQFLVRAAGGTVFWSTAGTTYPTSPGVVLYSGDSAWSSLSDVNAKENFRDLAPDDVLARIAAMPVREWNYKAQDQAIRHIGPTAQDFHAAFGLGQDERRISTIDADGVALAAIKALDMRMRAEHDAWQGETEALRAQVRVLTSLVEELLEMRRTRPQP